MYSCNNVLQIMVHCTIVLHAYLFLTLFLLGTIHVLDKITSLLLLFLFLAVLGYDFL